ncbi:M23 family metallopeptidase [Epilithonimonas caeni]|uniref:M23 family metallopeptidase n=1 Tax=Epilithonimonas caeni TaxID=365343 RepID=UPI001F1E6C51|nr:M23 family metallopeptidase [Epilithonimonas caeni]
MKKTILTLFIFAWNLSFAQFNTLMPIQQKKTEQSKIVEDAKEKTKSTEKKEKISWKKFFGITTKTDLKNQIDSLKVLMKQYANSDKKEKYARMKDSLLLLNFDKAYQENFPKKNKSLVMYDLIDEPEEMFSKIVMPIKNKIAITSPFGSRYHPIFGNTRFHNGIDLKANYENVYSVMDGIVSAVGWDPKGGGNFIKIKHFDRFETAYLHLSDIYYHVGERVNAGFIIARSGNTGNSTGPHLHFSVKEFGQSIDPAHFLNDLIKVNNLITQYNGIDH